MHREYVWEFIVYCVREVIETYLDSTDTEDKLLDKLVYSCYVWVGDVDWIGTKAR